MVKKIILGIVLLFIIMMGLTFWVFRQAESNAAADNARTEADFSNERFVVSELWEAQKKKGSTVLSSYIFMKVRNEPIRLRLPLQGLSTSREEIAGNIHDGDTVEVKVQKQQLAAAREGGAGKAIYRFIMGDKREVTIFKLSAHGQTLVDKDIHGWDEARITLLGRLADEPYLLVVPAFILIAIIGIIKKRQPRQTT